jgi:hypothetical protein
MVQMFGDSDGGGGGGGYWGGGGGGGGAKYENFGEESQSCRNSGGGGGGSSFVARGPLVAELAGDAPHITIAYTVLPAPTAAITQPAEAAVYKLGAAVRASFACSEGSRAPGIQSCEAIGYGVPNGALLDTSRLGLHQFGLTATSLDGLRTTVWHTYEVVPPPARATPPILTHLRESHRRWREGSALPKAQASTLIPRGTTFKFELNIAASVRFSFARQRAHSAAIVMTVAGRAGANSVRFEGRTSRNTRLGPGRYAVAVTASAWGERSSTERLSFLITR